MRDNFRESTDLVKHFIPFLVGFNVDITNDMDVCKFYPKFAQKRSHPENGKEKHFIIVYLTIFNQICFVFELIYQRKSCLILA